VSTLIEWMSDLERRVQKLERRCQEVRLTPRERFINRVNTLIEIREERSRMPDDNPLRMTLDEPFTPPGCEDLPPTYEALLKMREGMRDLLVRPGRRPGGDPRASGRFSDDG